MTGLVSYLVGEGKANEHTEPHIVAGSDALTALFGIDELSRADGFDIARFLDTNTPLSNRPIKEGHVWHCSLSLRADEGKLSDEKWQEIANDFMHEMGFDTQDGTKAPVRWVAVRHGVSKNGNDHIHIAMNVVRDDGTRADTYRERVRSQKAARVIEKAHGLYELESVDAERSTVGYKPGELEAAARRTAFGRYEYERKTSDVEMPAWDELSHAAKQELITAEMPREQPRFELGRTVRACATVANDEAEFVRRMRNAGLLVRPRFAPGTRDVIEGFKVAQRPEFGEMPIWYGGRNLYKDLSLPRLRESWESTPQNATNAAAEWRAAADAKRLANPGIEAQPLSLADFVKMQEQMEKLGAHLSGIPVENKAEWAKAARQASGTLAWWSNAIEKEPGELARASDVLARSASTWNKQTPHKSVHPNVAGAVSATMRSLSSGGQGLGAQLTLIRSVRTLAKATYQLTQASGQNHQALAVKNAVLNDIDSVYGKLKKAHDARQQTAVRKRSQSTTIDTPSRGIGR